MTMFRALVLHRAWLPAVIIVTLAVFIPRARAATEKMSRISRAAGVYDWSAGAANEFGDTRFRWMKPHAALQEPVRGRTLSVPLFVGRPGIESSPVTLRVSVEGVRTPPIVFQKPGWQIATFDLYEMLGEPHVKSLNSVTLTFDFAGLTADVSMPIVGLGDVHWSGAAPR